MDQRRSPQAELDRRRTLMLWAASGCAALATVAQVAIGQPQPAELVWQITCGVVCAGAAWVLGSSDFQRGTWALVGLAAFLIITCPFVVLAHGGRLNHLVIMVAQPMALMVLCIDRPRVGLSASVLALITNTIVGALLGWGFDDMVHMLFTMTALYGCGVLGAREYELMRRNEELRESERRTAEARQLQAERLATLGRLSAGVAHEINNPLAYVMANLNVLNRDFAELSDTERAEVLAETLDGVHRIADIVADLKGWARDDVGSNEVADVGEVVRQTLRIAGLRAGPDTKLVNDVMPGLPLARANHRRLCQVVLNLVMNACDAIEEHPGPKVVTVRARLEPQGLSIEVTDTGPGISPDVMPRLFEAFFTTKPLGKGTGLGLALSRELVESTGGSISARNGQRGGATFAVTLQRAADGLTPPVGSRIASRAA